MMRRLSALLLCSVSISAVAADASTLASPRASERSPAQAEQEIGVGLGVGPGYLGAGNTMWGIGLLGEANFSNGVFLSTVDGIGYRLPAGGAGWSWAASLGGTGERRESDGKDGDRNRLSGMGKVANKARANVFVNYDAGAWHAAVELHQTLAERRGTQVDVIGKYDALATGADLVQAFAGFSYANRSLMQTYFGVTPAQSAGSGHAAFAPAAGVAGAGAGLMWRHAFNREWVGTAGAGVTALRGAAADSPLTARRVNGSLGGSIAYRF